VHVIEINDSELMKALADHLSGLGIRNGAIVSLIGGADTFTISTMSADDATKDIVTEYTLPAEMSGTGEVVDGVPHVHAVMAVEGDRALSGHLHAAQIGTWFARVYVIPIDR
jgi:hypothetical protein